MARGGRGGSGGNNVNAKYGTNGDDFLDGHGPSYLLSGGKGDDTYQVDDSGDVVEERNNAGRDRVISRIDYVLGDNIEDLTLDGSAALSGTGNSSNNVLIGNAWSNALFGLGGNDSIDGGAGDDSLFGGDGDDELTGGDGADLIDGGNGTDTALFSGDSGNYTIERIGADLHITFGTTGPTDILRNVEYLSFRDGIVAVSDIGPGPGEQPLPKAVDDTGTGAEDNALTINVLTNDQGQGLTVAAATSGNIGSVTINADGTITYRPIANAHGTDQFTYTVRDIQGRTSTASVTVEVLSDNDVPIVVNDSFTVQAGVTSTGIGSVLANDSDVDGDSLAVITSNSFTAAGGSVVMAPNGTFTYTPAGGFVGVDSFNYTVSDGNGGQASATVSLRVESIGAMPHYVEALVIDEWRFNYPEAYGTADVVTFTFASQVPSYYGASSSFHNGFRAFSAQQQDATRAALDAISDFANITFVEVATASAADITFGLANLGGSRAWTLSPSADGVGTSENDIWLDAAFAGNTFVPGGDVYQVLIHEIGHTLGMDHPLSTELAWAENNRQHTVMSAGDPVSLGYEPETYMVYDIATLQYIYGANVSHATGNDVYTFADFASKLKSVWDAGGHDVFDLSAATFGVKIDLREGAFSTVDPWGQNNIAIAFGTVIEDAIGSAFADQITGNDAANRITGGAGNDLMTGRGGGDTYFFGTAWGDDTVTDFVRGEDKLDFTDTRLKFADLNVISSGGDTVITYGEDSVTLKGVATIHESDIVFS